MTLELPQSLNSIYGRNLKFNTTYLKREGKDYKKRMISYIGEEVQKQGWVKMSDRFLYMDEVVYSNRKGRDADNMKKLQQDCITESNVVWDDDSWCLPRTERILIDKYNPRIELVITLAPFVGIFNNENHFNQFEETCKKCTRYLKGRCSILVKSKEGRIQSEIKDFTCIEFKEK